MHYRKIIESRSHIHLQNIESKKTLHPSESQDHLIKNSIEQSKKDLTRSPLLERLEKLLDEEIHQLGQRGILKNQNPDMSYNSEDAGSDDMESKTALNIGQKT